MSNASLAGHTVVSFESRMADTTANLIEKHGGAALTAPSMQEVPLDEHGEVFSFADRLFDGGVDVLICTTGVGTRMLLETLETQHAREDVLEALAGVQIVARGPKPVRALKKVGLSAALKVGEPNTWREILQTLDDNASAVPVKKRVVAVQEYGRTNEQLNQGLKERGADVLQVPIYRWALPDDLAPLKEGLQAIIEGRADVALFTSRTQADHVMKLARQEGLEDPLRKGFQQIVVASIGPVCSKGLQSHGIKVDFEPERPKLGIFIKELAEAVAQ